MVSIPSRGFWFFEGLARCCVVQHRSAAFQSPRGDFGFLKAEMFRARDELMMSVRFQSPRGDFGFLKEGSRGARNGQDFSNVSIPSRGFWFFEAKKAQ